MLLPDAFFRASKTRRSEAGVSGATIGGIIVAKSRNSRFDAVFEHTLAPGIVHPLKTVHYRIGTLARRFIYIRNFEYPNDAKLEADGDFRIGRLEQHASTPGNQ